jgi:hypothetical protein
MSIYIDSSNRLHHDQAASFALVCPHCQVFSHVTAMSIPQFAELVMHKPNHVGIVYRCDSCNAPVFLKFPVKIYAGNRVELAPSYIELERPREKFTYTYLPEESELLFKEALSSYAHGAFNAFASMCRRTAQSVFRDLGEGGKLRIFDQVAEIRDMAELDADTYNLLKRVLFDNDADSYPSLPVMNGEQAGILLEVMKDVLYQAYIRRGKLQQAMMVRRYFAEESQSSKVTPFVKASS